MEQEAVIEKVNALIKEYLDSRGIELVDIIYRREQGMILRLLIDTPNGVTIDECEDVNRSIGEMLDKADIIEGRYTLEVSSPGLDRHLKSDRDFERALGSPLTVHTFVPVDGAREHEGALVGFNKDEIVINHGDRTTVIARTAIAKAVLAIDM